jgi:hypothetical protein
MLGTLKTHVWCSHEKKDRCPLMISLNLTQLLQLVNAWLVELGDASSHILLEKHNGKLLWSKQPNGKTSLHLSFHKCI